MSEIILVRHAPVDTGGRLIGRTDLAATLPATKSYSGSALDGCEAWFMSPALRCRQTAKWIAPDTVWRAEPLLLEQDFGEWDGREYASVPDLGKLSRAELARHRPPAGESFDDVVERTSRALPELLCARQSVIVAHAGVIRAFLGIALGRPEDALAFVVDPLSLTRLVHVDDGWAIKQVNVPLVDPV